MSEAPKITAVFDFDLRRYDGNPHCADTPFGRPVVLAVGDRIAELTAERDAAALHVESVIAVRTGFTGDPPYVGWEGLGLALTEALNERDALAEQVKRARDDALEEAARLIETTAYTITGDVRRLQPVSRVREGMDMHHATIAAAIRALRGATEGAVG